MAITDYIPNVFGSAAPTTYEGLLGMGLITPQQLEQTQKTANIQGLLGAGLALAQGMSKIGPRRSAAENILGALAGGFGAAGGAYQQGLQNIIQQQQLQSAMLTQRQAQGRMASIDQIAKEDPELARLIMLDPAEGAKQYAIKQQIKSFAPKGPDTPESLRAQGNAAYLIGNKPLGDSYYDKANRLEVEQRLRPPVEAQPVPVEAPVVQTEAAPGALPGMVVTEKRGPDAQLFDRKNQLLAENRSLAGLKTKEARDTIAGNLNEIKSIDDQLDRIARSSYDFTELEKSVPEKFKPQVRMLKEQVQTGAVSADAIASRVENIFTQVRESERGMKIDGLPGTYAQMKYKTSNQSELNPQQLADVIAFANAPTAEQYASLARESQRLQFETGRGSPVPRGRSDFLSVPFTPRTQVSPEQQVAPVTAQPVVATRQPVVTTPAQPTRREPAVVPAAPVVKSTAEVKAPENAPEQTKPLYQYNKNAIINRSDIPPKDKKDLLLKKPALESAVNYSLTSIIDARDAAQALLNNPQYIDSLTGRFSPLLVQSSILSQDAKTANDLLQNILTRSFVKEIQQMREASPTGGAVGSVTEREMEALSKVSASLSVGMNKDEFVRQLNNYLRIANRSISSIPREYSKTYGYSGEFDDLLTSSAVGTENIGRKKTPVEIELERRKKEK